MVWHFYDSNDLNGDSLNGCYKYIYVGTNYLDIRQDSRRPHSKLLLEPFVGAERLVERYRLKDSHHRHLHHHRLLFIKQFGEIEIMIHNNFSVSINFV